MSFDCPEPAQRMRPRPVSRRRMRTFGATLLERSILFALVAGSLAIIVPAFAKNLRTSKVSEAPSMLLEMSQAAQTYYEARHASAEGSPRMRCLPESTGLFPVTPTVDPQPVIFSSAEGVSGASWAALGLDDERTLRYSYEIIFPTAGCDIRVEEGRPLFTVRAEGDLDGDGTRSIFERSATIEAETGEVVPLGILYVTRRTE